MKFTGERMIPDYNEGQEIYLEHITRYIFASQFVKDKNILDIACGSGYGSDYLLRSGSKKVIGVDISEEAINYCKDKYIDENIEFLVGGVEKIPIENNFIDVIVSFETIEHVGENAQINFLNEVKRVLSKDGIFVVSTPNSLVYPKGNPYHLKELNFKEFNILLKSKFKNVDIYFQDDVESSYIYSEDNLKKLNKKFEIIERIDEILSETSMYLVAVCSDIKLENIIEYVGLSNIKPYVNLTQEVNSRNFIIKENEKKILELKKLNQDKDLEIKLKVLEIQFMESSKFWKIKIFYEKFKFPFFNFFRLIKKGLLVLKEYGLIIFIKKSIKYIYRILYTYLFFRNRNIKHNYLSNDNPEIKGLVSVVIPIYDRTIELKESIESILSQTYENFELILITDGSPEETISVVEEYRNNPKVKIFHYYNNTGNAVRGRNKGIRESNGEFIAFQDSDDIAERDRIEKSVQFINKYEADVVYGGWRAKLDGTRNDTELLDEQEIISPECNFILLKDICVPCQSTVMLRKKALCDVGGLKTIMQYREDHELWLRLAYLGYKFKAIPYVLTSLLLHKGNNELNFKKDDKKWKSIMLSEYKKKTTLTKKIAYIIPGTSISGGISVILNHANGLLKKGYDIFLISQDNITSIDWFPNQQVPIIALKDVNNPQKKYFFKNIDILIATHWTTHNSMLDIVSKRKIYFIQSDERNFDKNKKYKKDTQKTYESNDNKIEYMTMAKWIKSWLKDEFNQDASYVPNGLDCNIFHCVDPIQPKGNKIRILLEGPINIPFKGMSDAFEVVKDLDCEVWAVSSYGKPKPEWRCDRFFEKVNLYDMPAIYSSCDILLKMSTVESFAYPPLEMMACGGVPVILEVSGIEEYAVDGVNCLIVKNIKEAKLAILKLISDRNLYDSLVQAGLETSKKFNWGKSIDELEYIMNNEK